MKKQYNFANSRKNPYARALKKQITIRLEERTINYFKKLSDEIGIPYQTLINLYLRDCATKERKISMTWRKAS